MGAESGATNRLAQLKNGMHFGSLRSVRHVGAVLGTVALGLAVGCSESSSSKDTNGAGRSGSAGASSGATSGVGNGGSSGATQGGMGGAAAGTGGTGAGTGGSGGASGDGGGAIGGLGGMSQTGPVPGIDVAGGTLKLEVCAEDVVRVMFATDAAFFGRTSLAAAPKRCKPDVAWELVDSDGKKTLRTSRLELDVDMASGAVAFLDRAGNLVASEKLGGRTIEPAMVQGEATNHVRQEWQPNEGEALYGLGNYQQGLLDIKGYDLELSQYNTNAVVPLLVSSRGYGLFWDNTSYTRFGDLRDYEPVPGFDYAAGIDLTAAASGSADITAMLTPAVSGDYVFRTFASGQLALTVGGTKVIDHWRQGWLPDDEVARVTLTAGQPVPVRLEWASDIDVKTLSFSYKTPAAMPGTTSLWSEVGEGIDYYFLYGPELDGVISGYRRVTGQASLMPRWAFGLFQSREHYASAAEVSAAVAGYRSRGIPLDVIVQDWQYWPDKQWGSHAFDTTRFPDPAGLVTSLHDQHVKFMLSVWPKFYTNTANYAALQASGYTYPYDTTVLDFLDQPFAFYDAFNANARAAYWGQIDQQLFGLGVDAWWLDATEPEVVEGPYKSLAEGRTLCQTHMHPTALGSGSRMLNAYSLVNSQGIYEGQRAKAPDQRVFILTRSAFAGQQRYASATWSGDISSTWSAFKKQIPGGLGFALSGIPYWTVDSGGFAVPPRFTGGQNADEWRELNARWFEYATFLPLLRVHGQAPVREMWEFGGESSPAYAAMLAFDRLRYRLLPYFYSLAGAVTHRDGTMLRPLVMDFRSDAAALDVRDEFMAGPALLVSPVTDYQATSRSVYLPATPGGWYDFWTGAAVAGGATAMSAAPLERIPVHVRAGAIVPFGPDLEFTSQKAADPIALYVFAGADGRFELYEDDGSSYAYESGAFTRIPITWSDASSTLTLGAREGSYPDMLASRTFDIVVVRAGKAVPAGAAAAPDRSVTYDGTPVELVLP